MSPGRPVQRGGVHPVRGLWGGVTPFLGGRASRVTRGAAGSVDGPRELRGQRAVPPGRVPRHPRQRRVRRPALLGLTRGPSRPAQGVPLRVQSPATGPEVPHGSS